MEYLHEVSVGLLKIIEACTIRLGTVCTVQGHNAMKGTLARLRRTLVGPSPFSHELAVSEKGAA